MNWLVTLIISSIIASFVLAWAILRHEFKQPKKSSSMKETEEKVTE